MTLDEAIAKRRFYQQRARVLAFRGANKDLPFGERYYANVMSEAYADYAHAWDLKVRQLSGTSV